MKIAKWALKWLFSAMMYASGIIVIPLAWALNFSWGQKLFRAALAVLKWAAGIVMMPLVAAALATKRGRAKLLGVEIKS